MIVNHDVHHALPIAHRSLFQRDRLPFTGWTLDILPYIEADPLYSHSMKDFKRQPLAFAPPHPGLSTPYRIYSCPADGQVSTAQVSTRTNTLAAFTSYLGVSGKDYQSQDGTLVHVGAGVVPARPIGRRGVFPADTSCFFRGSPFGTCRKS